MLWKIPNFGAFEIQTPKESWKCCPELYQIFFKSLTHINEISALEMYVPYEIM